MNRAKKWLTAGCTALTPWRVGRVLALSALLAIGSGLYFNMTAASEVPNLSVTSQVEGLSAAEDQQRASDSIQERQEVQRFLEGKGNSGASKFDVDRVNPKVLQDVTEFFGEDVVAVLGYEVLLARLNHYQTDGLLSSRDLERLDNEIDVMLMAVMESTNATEEQGLVSHIEDYDLSGHGDEAVSPNTIEREAIRDWQRFHLPGIDRLDDLIAAELEACDKVYRSILPGYVNEVGNPASIKQEAVLAWQLSHLPGIDWLDDLIAAELDACNAAHRSFLPNYVYVARPSSQ